MADYYQTCPKVRKDCEESPFKNIATYPPSGTTLTKKVKGYVGETSLKRLVESGVLESYELIRGADGSEVTMTFVLDKD